MLAVVVAVKKAAARPWCAELGELKLIYLPPIILYNLNEAAFRGLHIVWFVFLIMALETVQQLQVKRPSRVDLAVDLSAESWRRRWEQGAGTRRLRRERLLRQGTVAGR